MKPKFCQSAQYTEWHETGNQKTEVSNADSISNFPQGNDPLECSCII